MADETTPATATATTSATAAAAATPTASGQPRPGYRGKCLYKTGKCNNERALKTSGQSHNLCDEHRHRQNEHQRKLDAKNRFARKDKRASGVKGDSPTGSAMAAAAVRAAHGHRYAPYGKVRMSPNAAAGVDDVHAILGRNGIVPQPMMQFHALGVDGANAMAVNGGAPMPGGSPEILPSGVVILPNGPQAPQMPYPSAMQDFDGIVVPLPSYLEGHERVEFRSRIYQKVLDFIAEECMRRFGAVGPAGTTAPAQMQPSMVAAMNAAAAAAAAAATGERRDEASNGAQSVAGAATAAPIATNTSEEAKATPSGEANSSETQDASGEKKAAETGKDDSGDDTQPEDAEEHGGEDETDEAPRSKRATRVRNARKDTQTI